jgi:hypothetical protein
MIFFFFGQFRLASDTKFFFRVNLCIEFPSFHSMAKCQAHTTAVLARLTLTFGNFRFMTIRLGERSGYGSNFCDHSAPLGFLFVSRWELLGEKFAELVF